MKTKNKTATKPIEPAARKVRFEFHQDGAQAVCIAGTFNDWRPNGLAMIAVAEGNWVKELALAPGTYEYRFVVDGEWVNDPNAEQVRNSYGGFNSVLIVEQTP